MTTRGSYATLDHWLWPTRTIHNPNYNIRIYTYNRPIATDILVEIGGGEGQHNHIKVVFLLPPDKTKIAYIDTERKTNRGITRHALHASNITRHGVRLHYLIVVTRNLQLNNIRALLMYSPVPHLALKIDFFLIKCETLLCNCCEVLYFVVYVIIHQPPICWGVYIHV